MAMARRPDDFSQLEHVIEFPKCRSRWHVTGTRPGRPHSVRCPSPSQPAFPGRTMSSMQTTTTAAPSGHLAAMADAAIAATRFAGAEKEVVLLPRLSAFSRLVAKPLRRDGGGGPKGRRGKATERRDSLARSLRGRRQRRDVVRSRYPCNMRRPVFAILVSALWVPILLIPFALLYGRLPPRRIGGWRLSALSCRRWV